jgi:rare lipoprotein A (peptidoglycan hydrolase)
LKGGALRNQSTGGRRLGVAAVICGVVFGAPLLLLQSTSATSGRARPSASADSGARGHGASRHGAAVAASRAARANGVKLPSNLVAYQAPTTTTTMAPSTTTTAAVPSTTAPNVAPHLAPTTTTTTAPVRVTTTTAPLPTTTTVPVAAATSRESGEATWYSGAIPGGCASPTLPFGTVLTVVNAATGASTECTVDDREEAGYPRVVDMSPGGFSEIASMSQGVVDVTISW